MNFATVYAVCCNRIRSFNSRAPSRTFFKKKIRVWAILIYVWWKKSEYILSHWHTQWDKKTKQTQNIHGLTNKGPPSSGYRRFLTTLACVCAVEVFTGARLGGTGVQPSNTHPTHNQPFQCTLGFNYHHAENAKTHGRSKKVKFL